MFQRCLGNDENNYDLWKKITQFFWIATEKIAKGYCQDLVKQTVDEVVLPSIGDYSSNSYQWIKMTRNGWMLTWWLKEIEMVTKLLAPDDVHWELDETAWITQSLWEEVTLSDLSTPSQWHAVCGVVLDVQWKAVIWVWWWVRPSSIPSWGNIVFLSLSGNTRKHSNSESCGWSSVTARPDHTLLWQSARSKTAMQRQTAVTAGTSHGDMVQCSVLMGYLNIFSR